MPTKERRIKKEIFKEWHKENGLCIECNSAVSHTSILCAYHLKLRRERDKRRKRKRYKNHYTKGTCVYCSNPSVEGTTMCKKHLEQKREKYKEKNRKKTERNIRLRKCTRCGVKLQEEDGKTCMNCSHRSLMKEMVYAKNRS